LALIFTFGNQVKMKTHLGYLVPMAAVRTLDLDAFQDGPQQCNEAAAEIRDSVNGFNVLLHILSLLKSLRAEETRVTTWVALCFLQERG